MSKSYFSLSAALFSLAYLLAASLSRCCGYGYRIVAVDGGRCVIQRRQQIFLDVADILPCSYIIITAKHAPAGCCVLRYGCNTANHADKKEVT